MRSSLGDVWEKAGTYLRQAGAKAFDRSSNREAATNYDQALSALKRLPENRDTIARAIDLRIEMRHALWPLGEVGQILDYLERAETLAETLQDQRRLAQVLTLQ